MQIELNQDEVQLLIHSLGELPAKHSFRLIAKLAKIAEDYQKGEKNSEKETKPTTTLYSGKSL
jgi:hypothetical protein